jgi:hypothetical protein
MGAPINEVNNPIGSSYGGRSEREAVSAKSKINAPITPAKIIKLRFLGPQR